MERYDREILEHIADSIGIDFDLVIEKKPQFEAAARWFYSDQRTLRRLPPSQLRRKLIPVARSARRLLKVLGIDDPQKASDGPQDTDIMDALGSAEPKAEDMMIRATKRIGVLVETLEAMTAAEEIERLASIAIKDSKNLGPHISPPGHRGKAHIIDWAAAMMGIYHELTGREPTTSVGAQGSSNRGIASGALIRFLSAAGAPLGIELTPDSWRERVRLVKRHST